MSRQNKQNIIRLVLKVVLPIACLLWLAFIFSNSLQTGEESSQQSMAVVETVQQVAQVIAPESEIANATGDAYEELHSTIRSCAHFSEFSVLGALLCWCYFVYTFSWQHAYLPVIGVLLVPLFDEGIQILVAGRGWEIADLLLDAGGGAVGILFAALSILLGKWIYKKTATKGVNI